MEKTLILLLFISFVFGCAHVPKGAKVADGIYKETDEESALADIYWEFLKSEDYALNGNYERARSILDTVIKAYPDVGYLYYEKAVGEADQKNLEQSIEQCEKALKLSPKLIQARLLLARLYSAQEKHVEAINILEEAISDSPREEEAYSLLAGEYIQLKKYNQAVGTMHRLILVEPESNLANYYLGLLYGSYLKQHDKALSYFQKILEVDSENVQVHASVAQIYLERGNLKKALAKLSEIEQMIPDDISVQLKIALIHYEQKDYKKAIERFEKILAANPESDKIRFYLGVIYTESGDAESGAKHFKLITAKSDYFRDAILHIAQFYYSTDKKDEAIAIIEQAVREKPDEMDFYNQLTSIYEADGDYKKVADLFKIGVEANPGNEKLLFALGVAYEKAGNTDAAIETMKKVIILNPQNASALNFIGYSYVEKGENLDVAENMLQEAAALRPDDGYILDSLGWLYFKKGDLTRAYDLLNQATAVMPQEATVHEHLGDLHKLRQDFRSALASYKKALKCLKDRKKIGSSDYKRIEEKICEVGGCKAAN